MTDAERRLLGNLRRSLLHLHKTLLDWERAAYDRAHGRTSPGELLHIVMTDPQFAWLRPLSELIVRIDGALEMEPSETSVSAEAIVAHARLLVAPEDRTSAYGQRYLAALQEQPDAVLAHRAVTTVLKSAPPGQDTVH
jgi:hypothetical protein